MRSASGCSRPVAGRVLYNPSTGEFLPLPCNTWGCSVCGPAKAHRVGVLAARARPERFVTLSKVGSDLETVSWRLKTLSKSLRRSGKAWEYLAVPEVHQNGFWHLHLLQKGDFIPQRELSRRAASAGMGSVVWIERVQGEEQVSSYLCKYLTKDLLDREISRSRRSKRFRTSRGFWPGGLREHSAAVWGSSSPWSVQRVGPYSDPA